MVTATTTGPIPENASQNMPASMPESVQEAIQSAPLVLPEGRHTINIKMAKKHPFADVINAVGQCVLAVVTGTITYLYAKRQIDEGSAFAPIQAALNIITGMRKQG